MAFVKDDHSYTRGPGAIASLDAASPARRLSAARAELALRRRDAIMALGAARAGNVVDRTDSPPPRPPRPPGRPPVRPPVTSIETGQEAAFSRTPAPKTPTIKLPFRPRGLEAAGVRPTKAELVKLPGTVIEPPKPGTSTPTQGATSTGAPPTKTVVVGGGSGTSWTAPASKAGAAAASFDNPPPAFAPEPEEAPASTPVAPSAKPQGNLLLYAALGIGAWWLLTRK